MGCHEFAIGPAKLHLGQEYGYHNGDAVLDDTGYIQRYFGRYDGK
jgi:hypothetical protein